MAFDNAPRIVKEARWHQLPAGDFLCIYLDVNSPEYNKVRNKYTAPVRKLIERELLPPEKDREIMLNVFAEHVIKDWRHVTEDGEPVPYTVGNVIRLLTESPQTFYDLLDVTREQANYRPTPDQIKNS